MQDGARRTVGYLGQRTGELRDIFRDEIGDRWDFVVSDGPAEAPEFRAMLPQIDYLVVSARPIRRDLVSAAPRLKLLHRFGVGYDDTDVHALWEHGVEVAVCPHKLAETVAEQTLALTLAALKRITFLDDAIRNRGEWPNNAVRSKLYQLSSATVGIVGFGRIGQAAARLFLAFGCRLLVHTRSATPASHGFEAERADGRLEFVRDLDALFERSSIVSLHCPLTPETRHLANEARLRLLGPRGLLVNTARGTVVDQVAMTRLLASGELGFAALDVLEEEKAGTGVPLYRADNVIITPHVGGGGSDVLAERVRYVLDNIAKFEAGQPVADIIKHPA